MTEVPVEYLTRIGSLGGKSTSEAKQIAARLNGLSGGRPRSKPHKKRARNPKRLAVNER